MFTPEFLTRYRNTCMAYTKVECDVEKLRQAFMSTRKDHRRRHEHDLEPDSVSSGGLRDVDDGGSENAGHSGSQNTDISQPENANDSTSDAHDSESQAANNSESEAADDSEESSEKTSDSESSEEADNSGESSEDSDYEGKGWEDASEESEDDGQNDEWALWPSWNVNYAARVNLPELERGPAHAKENSLVWPPMLLVITGLALEDNQEAINDVRETLAKSGTEISAAEVVCCEGNQIYTLLTLPPTGVAFAAAKAADDFYHEHEEDEALPWCCYPSLRDMVDARNGRIPESTRRFVSGLRYQGVPSEDWKNLKVELVLDDGVHVGRGVCCEFVEEFFVDVQVMDVVEDLVPLDWKDSVCRWKTKNVLYAGVSLFERLRQHRESGTSVYFSEDCHVEADASDVQQNQGVLRDLENLTTVEHGSIVAPWFCSSKDDEALESLSLNCSQLCGDGFQKIENPFRALPERDFGEQYVSGLEFEKQLQDYEETRMEQILAILSQASTEKVLMKRLGIANNISLAEDVMERLEALHKLNGSGKESGLVSKMIESARTMELSTLRSISEHVQLEKQWKHILDGMERTGNETIHKFMEEQHQALLKMLLQTKDAQIAKIEEFVSQKFKLLNDINKTRKETDSVVGWLSKHTAKATYKVKRTHMIEKKMWETQVMASKAELEAARLEADKLAQRWEEERAKQKEQTEKAKAVLQEKEDHIRQQLDEQKKRELQILRQQLEVEKRAELQSLQQRLEKQKKVELQAVEQRLEEISNSVVSCAVCFESLEGTFSKKRNRDGVILKRRSCFVPCMHANMCSNCSEDAWDKYRRCPVCNTICPTEPKPIFVV